MTMHCRVNGASLLSVRKAHLFYLSQFGGCYFIFPFAIHATIAAPIQWCL